MRRENINIDPLWTIVLGVVGTIIGIYMYIQTARGNSDQQKRFEEENKTFLSAEITKVDIIPEKNEIGISYTITKKGNLVTHIKKEIWQINILDKKREDINLDTLDILPNSEEIIFLPDIDIDNHFQGYTSQRFRDPKVVMRCKFGNVLILIKGKIFYEVGDREKFYTYTKLVYSNDLTTFIRPLTDKNIILNPKN